MPASPVDFMPAFPSLQANQIAKGLNELPLQEVVSAGNVSFGGSVYATYTAATCKCKYTISTACSYISLVYNSLLQGTVAGTPDILPANNFEIKVSLELSDGTLIPVFFGTDRLILMKPGVTVTSNPVGVTLAAGEVVYVRTFVNRIISNIYTNNVGETGRLTANLTNLIQSYSARGGVFPTSNEGAVFTTSTGVDPFLTDSTDSGLVAGSNNVVFGPVEILAIPAEKDGRSIVVLGDSIPNGAGDAPAPLGGTNSLMSEYAYGLVNRAFCPLGVAFTKLAIGGETALEWTTNTKTFRRQVLINNSTALIMLGTNDIAGGASAATTQSRLTTVVSRIRRYVDTIYVTTILPRSSSTNGWTTLANQVASTLGGSFTTTKNTVNDWLRSGGLGSDINIIDLADVAESSRNSGLWKAGTIAASGTATGGSGTTIVDSGATWAVNQWYGYVATNLATGQSGYILSNTATTLTFTSAPAFSPVPGIGDAYSIALSWTGDTVHPTPYGHAQIAAALATRIFT